MQKNNSKLKRLCFHTARKVGGNEKLSFHKPLKVGENERVLSISKWAKERPVNNTLACHSVGPSRAVEIDPGMI
jgi:hypothetical protein